MAGKRNHPEADLQREVFNHLRQRPMPGVFAFHPPNGGKRRRIEAAILKGLGVVAGVPDVILIQNGMVECIELKSKKGRLSRSQEAAHKALRGAGVNVVVFDELNPALRYLETNGYLRGTMS